MDKVHEVWQVNNVILDTPLEIIFFELLCEF